jgi:hypothetical protein
MEKLQTDFIMPVKQVTPERYYEMLEVLPPAIMTLNGFLVGEPVTHNNHGLPLYDCYYEKNGQYFYAGLTTIQGFKLWVLPEKRLCGICGDELSPLDDLKCGYHDLE